MKGIFEGYEKALLWRSADGVSMAAQYAELVAYSITLAYNLRHSALLPQLPSHMLLCNKRAETLCPMLMDTQELAVASQDMLSAPMVTQQRAGYKTLC